MLANKHYLTQAAVQKILEAADQYAAKHKLAVTIAVCDEGGHMLGLIRRDGCAPLSAYIAHTIGAVGVSGVKSAEDAATAKAGIAAIL